uniref:Leucine-rich PPR motif-containing protein, mitochondrial n=1 Tax=Cacopsylla melanoneura TaxID=428564 RepID=A0A8D8WIM4_9HEMI
MFSIGKFRRRIVPIFKYLKEEKTRSKLGYSSLNTAHSRSHCVCTNLSTYSTSRQIKSNVFNLSNKCHNTTILPQGSQYQTNSKNDLMHQLHESILAYDVDRAFNCLKSMQTSGVPIRCHYFWPLIIQSYNQHGETGVLDVLDRMLSLNITIDHETLVQYLCPRLNLSNAQLAIRKLQDRDLKIVQILTPISVCLLDKNDIEQVMELCFTQFPRTKLSHEDFISALVEYYIDSNDKERTIQLIKRAESIPQATDLFLTKISQSKNPLLELEKVQVIITELLQAGLDFSSDAAYDLKSYFSKHKLMTSDFMFYQQTGIRAAPRLDVDRPLKSPTDMNTTDLECLAFTQKSQGLDSTATLKRLLLKYCQEKMYDKAQAVREELLIAGAELSPGVLSSCIDILIHFQQADEAAEVLTLLRETAPHFNVDEYKIIDLAKVYVQQNQFQKALSLVSSISSNRLRDRKRWERNVRDLLLSFQREDELLAMFNVLCEMKLCDTTSTPVQSTVIRYFLNRNNLDAALQYFERFSKSYRKTPLKHELLCACISQQKHKQVSRVLNIDTRLHGRASSHVAYITALSELNCVEQLDKFVKTSLDTSPKFIQKLTSQIQRLSDENKTNSLTVLSQVFRQNIGLLDHIFTGLLRIHCRTNANDEIKLLKDEYERIKTPTKEFTDILNSMSKI